MKIMAVDLGDARTGLAVCDRTEFLASPIGVIHDRVLPSICNKVAIAVEEYDERNIQVVRYAPCIQITPPNKMRRLSLIFAAKCAEIMRSIHKRPDRPTFQRDIANLAEHLAAISHTHGLLLGRMNALGFSIRFAEQRNHSGLG